MNELLNNPNKPLTGAILRPLYHTLVHEPDESLRKAAMFQLIGTISDDIQNHVERFSQDILSGRYQGSLVWTLEDLYSEARLHIMEVLLSWYDRDDKTRFNASLAKADNYLRFDFNNYIYLATQGAVYNAYYTTNLMVRLPIRGIHKIFSDLIDVDYFDEDYHRMDEQASDKLKRLHHQVLSQHAYLPIYSGDESPHNPRWEHITYGEIPEDIDMLRRQSDYVQTLSLWLDQFILKPTQGTLTERECQVLVHRFGLDDGLGPRTLEEVGVSFGVTRERIRQIEAKALRRLRFKVQRMSKQFDHKDMIDYLLLFDYELPPQ